MKPNISPQNKNDEKSKRGQKSQKLQNGEFQTDIRKNPSLQWQKYWRRLPRRVVQTQHFWSFSKAIWTGSWKTWYILEVSPLSRGLHQVICNFTGCPRQAGLPEPNYYAQVLFRALICFRGNLAKNLRAYPPKCFAFVKLSGFDKKLLQQLAFSLFFLPLIP